MNTDKKSVEALIDRLTDKTLSFGLEVLVHEHTHSGWDGIYRVGEILNEGRAIALIKKPKGLQRINLDWHKILEGKSSDAKLKIIGHPITLPEILNKLKKSRQSKKINDIQTEYDNNFYINERHKLLNLWDRCVFTKSINQLVEESGWEFDGEDPDCIHTVKVTGRYKTNGTSHNEQLKDENTRSLIEFIISLKL